MERNKVNKSVYTSQEVSVILNIPLQQVYKLTRQREIPSKKIGQRRIVYPIRQFEDWLNKVEVEVE